MANDKNFVIKNGLQAGRYLQTGGTETAGSEGYAVSALSYDSKSFSVQSQQGGFHGMSFKADGTKVFVVGNSPNTVFSYTLSTAWDISTASYDSVSFSVNSQEGSASAIFVKPDGTKFYVSGSSADTVFQYSMSTAWDLSTASYDSVSFSVASQSTAPTVIEFKPDGSKMYVGGPNTDAIYQYTLSTAWNVSTASYDSVNLSQGTGLWGATFSPSGGDVFILDNDTDQITKYTLSTAWDLSTATSDSTSPAMTESSSNTDIKLKSDGTKIYVAGNTNDSIYQYSTVSYTQTLDLSTGTYFSFTPSATTTVSFTNAPASGKAVGFAVEINGDGSAITWPTSVKWPSGTAPTATASKEVYAFVTTDGGTTYYGKQAAEAVA